MFGLFRQAPLPTDLFEAFVTAVSTEWNTAKPLGIPLQGDEIAAATIKQLERRNFRPSREQEHHLRSCSMVIDVTQDKLCEVLDDLVSSNHSGDRLQREISCINLFEELRVYGMPVMYFCDKRGIVSTDAGRTH